MPTELPIAEAKARFAEWVRKAEAGHELVLTRHGRAVARLVPMGPEPSLESLGPGESDLAVAEPGATYEAGAVDEKVVAARRERVQRILERDIWPRIPKDQLGKPISKREREEILGLGPEGV